MAILESVRELASKLGADTNGRTIADQINIINRHLEADTANDIAGAVKEYSKKAGSGGGGVETFEVNATLDSVATAVTIDQNFDDVWEAISAGKKIVGTLTVDSAIVINCVGVSTVDKPDNKAIFFMYDVVLTPNGVQSVSVAFDKVDGSTLYYAGYATYQLANEP